VRFELIRHFLNLSDYEKRKQKIILCVFFKFREIKGCFFFVIKLLIVYPKCERGRVNLVPYVVVIVYPKYYR